jgi:hypothetical protein
MKKMKKLILSGLTTLVLMLSATAHAQTYWSSNGGGCVPEDPSIQSNLYWTVTGGMRVKFQPGKSGTIKLVCPVTTSDLQGVNVFEMYYQDPDGYGTAYRVTAALRSVQFTDGAYSTVCTADSHSVGGSPTGGWSRKTCNVSALDGDRFQYWVEVQISAVDTVKTVEFNVARLTYVIP